MHRRVNSDGIDPFDEAHMFVGVQEHADIQESDISLRHLVLAKNRLAYWAGRFVEEFQFFEPGEDGNPTYRFTLQRHHSRKNGFTKSIISSGSGDSKAHLQSVSDQMGITDLTQELNAAN